MRPGKVKVVEVGHPLTLGESAPVDLGYRSAFVPDREGEKIIEMLVAALSMDAEMPETLAKSGTPPAAFRRKPVTQGLIARADLEALDDLGLVQAPLFKIGQGVRGVLKAGMIESHHLVQDFPVVHFGVEGIG